MNGRQALERSLRVRELAGDGRAGSFARAKARRTQRAFIRTRWPLLSLGWIILVAPVPLLWWFLPSDLLRGALFGSSVTGATAAVWFVIVQSTGTAAVMMGDEAEQWTAQALRKIGHDWRVVNRFRLSSYGDLDHVAVGPAGVLVVETKWSAYPWRSPDGLDRVRAAVSQVQRVERQLRLWTAVKKRALHVRPVVVVWGGGGWGDTNGVQYIDGVAVVEGNALRDWARSLDPDPASSLDSVREVWDALDDQARRRDEYDPTVVAVPLSVIDVLVRLGSFVAGAVLGFIAIATLLDVSGSPWMTSLVSLPAVVALLIAHRRWRGVRTPALGALVGVGLPTILLAGALAEALIT